MSYIIIFEPFIIIKLTTLLNTHEVTHQNQDIFSLLRSAYHSKNRNYKTKNPNNDENAREYPNETSQSETSSYFNIVH